MILLKLAIEGEHRRSSDKCLRVVKDIREIERAGRAIFAKTNKARRRRLQPRSVLNVVELAMSVGSALIRLERNIVPFS